MRPPPRVACAFLRRLRHDAGGEGSLPLASLRAPMNWSIVATLARMCLQIAASVGSIAAKSRLVRYCTSPIGKIPVEASGELHERLAIRRRRRGGAVRREHEMRGGLVDRQGTGPRTVLRCALVEALSQLDQVGFDIVGIREQVF